MYIINKVFSMIHPHQVPEIHTLGITYIWLSQMLHYFAPSLQFNVQKDQLACDASSQLEKEACFTYL